MSDRYPIVSEMCRVLFEKHGLLEAGWRFGGFDRAKTRCGVTKYDSKSISLSCYYIAKTEVSEENVRNTILHEIAHALTPGHHHDAIWQEKALAIGCNGERCANVGQIALSKWVVKCGNEACGIVVFERHKLQNKMQQKIVSGHLQCVKCKCTELHMYKRGT